MSKLLSIPTGQLLNTVAPLWTPADMQTEGWWDAADAGTITHVANAVSQWDDKSGNARHFTQATAANKPTTNTRTINGVNALDLDGTNDRMTLASTINAIGREIWAVITPDAFTPTAKSCIVFTNAGGANNQAAGTSTSGKLRTWGGGTNPFSADTPSVLGMTIGVPGVFGWLAHRSTKKFSINGTLETTTNTYVTGSLDCNNLGQGQFSFLDGAVGELIVVNPTSTATRQKIEGYLAHKWGMSANLPANHPYKSAAPTAGKSLLRTATLTPWTPAEITTRLWLDADSASTITESLGAVSQWNDKSGNAYNVTQGTGANQPLTGVDSQGGRNLIKFDGVNDFLISSTIPANFSSPFDLAVYSIFVAGKASDSDKFVGKGNAAATPNGTNNTRRKLGFGRAGLDSGSDGSFAVASVGIADSTFAIRSVVATSITDVLFSHNGTTDVATFGGIFNLASTNTASLTIGCAFSNGAEQLNGSIGEIIIVPSAVSVATRERIEGYLAWRWDMVASLPGGHPYKLEPPMT